MKDLVDFCWEVLFPPLVISVVLAVLLTPLINWFAAVECEQRWAESGMEAKYRASAGCLININGRWIPASAYKVTQ